jgi:hypothetical protein
MTFIEKKILLIKLKRFEKLRLYVQGQCRIFEYIFFQA